jgi:hypothetical protein
LKHAKVFIRDAVKKERPTIKPNTLMAPHREAALAFVWGIQAIHLNVTGKWPPFTAKHTTPRAPFVRIVQECLRLVGSTADEVKLINRLQAISNEMNDRLGHDRRTRKKQLPDPDR